MQALKEDRVLLLEDFNAHRETLLARVQTLQLRLTESETEKLKATSFADIGVHSSILCYLFPPPPLSPFPPFSPRGCKYSSILFLLAFPTYTMMHACQMFQRHLRLLVMPTLDMMPFP